MTAPRRALSILALALAGAGPASGQETILVEQGSPMVYLAGSSDPGITGAAWTAEGFDDSSWTPGVYGVGYESASGAENLITTDVPWGTKFVYTRATFAVPDVGALQTLFVGADYDDAWMVWINGVAVYRSPELLGSGAPTWDNLAALHESSNAASPVYAPWHEISAAGIPALHDGVNVLAVGIWNGSVVQPDLVLVPQLVANRPTSAVRGPYLQLGTPTSMTLRWRTALATDSRVAYGPAPGSLTTIDYDPALVTEHVVTLAGLTPDTTYYYSVGSSLLTWAGDDAGHFFRTSPLPGIRKPARIWTIGDSGTASATAASVRDAFLTFSAGVSPDLWLMLGDNAYNSGTDPEYQAAVFDMYPGLLATSPLWPTFGNHESLSASSTTQSGVYYDIFTLPKAAEAGGVVSGTEAYFSFDYANIHFVCLDTYETSMDPNGPMLTWLTQDMLATAQDWVIAYFHHPPYTKGTYDSDNPTHSGGRHFRVRQNVLPILEGFGVDLVLAGHSHVYERSFLLDGHYGDSTTLTSANLLDPGDGRVDGTGAYQKATGGPAPHEGAVYVVAGNAAKLGSGTLDHPAMYVGFRELGSVVIDIDGDRMDLTYLNNSGVVHDRFTLVKDTGALPAAGFTAAAASGVAPLAVDFFDQSSTNTAAWSWDLDGDGTADSAARNPSFVYASPGLFDVTLTASNASGADVLTEPGRVCVAGPLPGGPADLRLSASGTSITWSPVAGAGAYDVVRGGTLLLHSAGGNFSGAHVTCIENDGTDMSATDAATPVPGGIFFYLARSLGGCALPGTYDGADGAQISPRDTGIASAAGACP